MVSPKQSFLLYPSNKQINNLFPFNLKDFLPVPLGELTVVIQRPKIKEGMNLNGHAPSSQGMHLLRAQLLPPSVTSSGVFQLALNVGHPLVTAHFDLVCSGGSGLRILRYPLSNLWDTWMSPPPPTQGLQQTQITEATYY